MILASAYTKQLERDTRMVKKRDKNFVTFTIIVACLLIYLLAFSTCSVPADWNQL